MPLQPLRPRTAFALLALAGFGMLAVGVLLTELLSLNPCPLCILQRILYALLGLLAVLGLLAGRSGPGTLVLAAGCALAAAAGLAAAGWQSWLQRFPSGGAECTAAEPWWEKLVNWAGERLPLLFRPSGICSDPGLRIVGLSIAEWSAIVFALLLALSLLPLLAHRRG